jgi:antitoxin ParD1/3/4
MPSSYTLGAHFEKFIQAQLAGGRYNNASEVLRDALRMMEESEQRLAAALQRGLDDIEAGRVYPMEEVTREVMADIDAIEARQKQRP